MKSTILRSLSLSVALMSPLALVVGCSENHSSNSSHEVSHSESDKTGWFGGQTHEANTVYKNSDGSTSIETETTTVKGNVTTIVRDKKTTDVNGTVKTQRETRTIVKGTDSTTSETKTTSN